MNCRETALVGAYMKLRRIVAVIIIAAVFFWAPSPSPSVIPARAVAIAPCGFAAVPVTCLPTTPPSSSGLGVGGGLAIGIIATAGVLCIYDIWLKINGYKNWDGTPKAVQGHNHHHP